MTEQAALHQLADNTLQLHGVINAQTVLALVQELEEYVCANHTLTLDLSHVQYSNSCGLALLIACLRTAKKQNKTVHFTHLPQQIQAMANVMGLSELLLTSSRVE